MENTWFEIKSMGGSTDPESLEVLIYDEIGGWGIQASELISMLKAEAPSRLNLRINSPGGSVFEALAIFNYLREAVAANKLEVTSYVDGYAASAASIVALAGRVVMPANARMMIHNPWTQAAGDADQLRKHADLLDSIANNLADIYAAKTGMTREQAVELMRDETWFDGNEALAIGLADEVIADVAIAAKWDMAKLPKPITAKAEDMSEETTAPNEELIEDAPEAATEEAAPAEAEATEQPAPEASTSDDTVPVLVVDDSDDPLVEAVIELNGLTAKQEKQIASLTADLDAARQLVVERDQQLSDLADKAQVLQSQLDLTAYNDVAEGADPVEDTANAGEDRGNVYEQFLNTTDPAERTRLYRQHRAEIQTAARIG